MKYKPYEITVESVYGFPEPPVPAGLESTGEFRPSKVHECYLTTYLTAGYGETDRPRIILRKKKIKRIIYTQVRTGTPQPGEFYPSNGENGEVMFKCKPGNDDYMKNNYPNVPIFKREEEEV